MKRLAKAILTRTALYDLVKARSDIRLVTRSLRTRDESDIKKEQFYSQFVVAGDLVFDVGANMGNRLKTFMRLGARVVAYEPQPRCFLALKKVYSPFPGVIVRQVALGAKAGTGKMLVSDIHTLSSLSPNWVAATQKSGRFGQQKWNRRIRVAVGTLDEAIATYGIPAFIKIDVEGYERDVIQGLSTPVKALSFEFTPECIETALFCVEHLSTLHSYRFQISFGESMVLGLPAWVDAPSIKSVLRRLDPMSFGDVYVRSLDPV